MNGLIDQLNALFFCQQSAFCLISFLFLLLFFVFYKFFKSLNFYVLQHIFIKFLNIAKNVKIEWLLKISDLRKKLYFSSKKVVIMFGQN